MLRRIAENRRDRSRAGITLTEILISIMIMGVGIISLATLFPIGLLRLRNAQRSSRSAFLTESAAADLSARNLLAKYSFISGPAAVYYSNAPGGYDPWVQDTPSFGANWGTINNGVVTYAGVHRGVGPGLPVAYDPLWRAVTGIYITSGTPASEARFGSGIGFVRNDPNPGNSNPSPSAHGLQRITNLPTLAGAFTAFAANATAAQLHANQNSSTIGQIFVSPEDIIFQDPKAQPRDVNNAPVLNASPVIPDLTANTTATNDWRFTWMFTGQQSDASNGAVYDGDIVIFENRQFALDVVAGPFASAASSVAGETTVEAAWGYSTTPPSSSVTVGYANGSNRSVLLRWPATLPDPDVRVGGWIADVTYERDAIEQGSRSVIGGVPTSFPLQRCHWYQVAKKSEPTTVAAGTGGFPADASVNYRVMTVWTSTPLRAKTPIVFSSGQPYHVEAALIAPSVVNVFPRTVYTR